MKKMLNAAFYALVGTFLAGGAVVVTLQFVGVLGLNSALVAWPYEWLAPCTFAAATIASLVAFMAGIGSEEE